MFNLQQMVLFWTDAFVVAGTLIIMIREHNRAKKGVKSVFASILNLSRFDWYTRFYKWFLTMRSFVCHNAAPNTRNSNLLFKWASRWVSAHVEWYRFRKRFQKFWATMLRSWLKEILRQLITELSPTWCQPMFAQLSLMEFQVDQLQLEIPLELKSPCEQGVLPDIIKTRARRLNF